MPGQGRQRLPAKRGLAINPIAENSMADGADAWILWVDGVGGFLVCTQDSVTLGQAYAEPPADVPLLADVSRRHAVLRRDGEGYWLEADRPTWVNNTPATRALLRTDDRISL